MLEIGASRPPSGLLDTLALVVTWSVASLVTLFFGWLLVDLVAGGVSQLSWSFLIESPRNARGDGGIGSVLVSTAWILAICLGVVIVLGTGAAVWLAEYAARTGTRARWVRRSLDVLAGVPSIVFGLFGSVLFGAWLGLGFSILAGGLTLACMVLPIYIRAAEAGLRAVPDDQRRAAAALGLSRTTTLWRVLLPGASAGLAVGLVLGVGRAAAETAALLYTAGYVDRMPTSWLDSGRSLSVHIFDLSMNVYGGEGNAYAAALVLVGLLLAINLVASAISARFGARSEGAW
ncbi:MAG: phosphate ABC transporter permease PstA [Myxococcota bacterium]